MVNRSGTLILWWPLTGFVILFLKLDKVSSICISNFYFTLSSGRACQRVIVDKATLFSAPKVEVFISKKQIGSRLLNWNSLCFSSLPIRKEH